MKSPVIATQKVWGEDKDRGGKDECSVEVGFFSSLITFDTVLTFQGLGIAVSEA